MSKKMHVKTKPQDATLRNVRAARKRNAELANRVSLLERRVGDLEERLSRRG